MSAIDWTLILIGAGAGVAAMALGAMIALAFVGSRRKSVSEPEPAEWPDDPALWTAFDSEVAIQQTKRMIGASKHRVHVMESLLVYVRELESDRDMQAGRVEKLSRIARVIEESS